MTSLERADQAVLRQESLIFKRVPTVDEKVSRGIRLDRRGNNLAAVGFMQQVGVLRHGPFNQEMPDILQARAV